MMEFGKARRNPRFFVAPMQHTSAALALRFLDAI
jgi:hypothetical protein